VGLSNLHFIYRRIPQQHQRRHHRGHMVTLRTFKVHSKPAPTLSQQDVVSVREQLHLSRPVFARYLRTNPRTLENWEQGRARPNAQAALLIRMVAQFPDMVQRLEAV
jgi:putative transcriptional regulator